MYRVTVDAQIMINALKTTWVVRIPRENVRALAPLARPLAGPSEAQRRPQPELDALSKLHGVRTQCHCGTAAHADARPLLHWHARPLQFKSSQLGWRSRWQAQTAGGRLGWAANWQVRSVPPRYRDSCGMHTQTDHRPSQRLASTSTTATPRPTRTSAAGPLCRWCCSKARLGRRAHTCRP